MDETELPLDAVDKRYSAVSDVQILNVAELVLLERVPRDDLLRRVLPGVEDRLVGDPGHLLQLSVQDVRLRDDVPVRERVQLPDSRHHFLLAQYLVLRGQLDERALRDDADPVGPVVPEPLDRLLGLVQ